MRYALAAISAAPRERGRFYRDRGVSPATLSALHYRGLAETDNMDLMGIMGSILDSRWSLTPAGRLTLTGEQDGH